jgi:cobalamin biosynthesis protein CobT
MLIDAKEENIDGLSIELVAKQFGQDYPDHRKILFHISDGEPASSHYGGDEAYKHTNEVCQNVRKKLDIEVYGIGICDAFSDPVGNKLYGKENFVVLEDVKSSVGVITRFLKQICNKRINMTQSSY